MKDLLRDTSGGIAIHFGILIIPLLGVAGVALDYSRVENLRTTLQARSDATALNVVVMGPEHQHGPDIAQMVQDVRRKFGGSIAPGDLAIDGQWLSSTDFRVAARGSIDTALVHILPGIGPRIDVSVEAVARRSEQELHYEPPVHFNLEPDAGDYNQIYAYCFNYVEANPNAPQQNSRHRSQMTLVADNDGNEYDFEWPRCNEGESLSFRMRNVRHARAHPELWDDRTKPPYRAEFDFYTDTVISGGSEHIDIVREIAWVPTQWRPHYEPGLVDRGYSLLETVRCDSLEECKPESQGGIIPEGRHRNPNVEDRACAPGKYMYFGWEDRPPHQAGPNQHWTDPAWTDRDYDDIRIVMRCPETAMIGERSVRLIR